MQEKVGIGLMRISTEEQGLTQHGSLDAQYDRMIRFLDFLNQRNSGKYTIKKFIKEEQSAFREKNEKRPELLELIEAIKNKTISFIIFEAISRFIRDTKMASAIYRLAEINDVEIWEVESGINYVDPKNPYLYQMFIGKALNCEGESIMTSNRVTTKHREAMVNYGKDPCPRPILGLDSHPNRVGMYVPNHEELIIVKDIMRAFVKFKSYSETLDYCHNKGFKTKLYFTKEKVNKEGFKIPPKKMGGESFSQTSLKAMLSNEKYSGIGIFKDTKMQFPKKQDSNKMVVWNYAHGRLIDQELLDEVASVMAIAGFKKRPRKLSGKSFSLLGGLLISVDGTEYQCNTAKNGRYSYYQYPKIKHLVSMTVLDQQVLDLLASYSNKTSAMSVAVSDYVENLKNEIDSIGDDIILVANEVEILKKDLDTLYFRRRQLLTDNGSENLIQIISDEIKSIESQLKDKVQMKTELSTKKECALMSYDPEMLKANLLKEIKKIQSATGDEKRLLLRKLVKKVVMDSKSVARVIFEVSNLVSPSRAKPGGNLFVGTEKWWVKQDLNL